MYIITNSFHYKGVEEAIKKGLENWKELPIGWYNGKPIYRSIKKEILGLNK